MPAGIASFQLSNFYYLRQRKDACFDWLYPVSRMKKLLFTSQATVEEVLRQSPQSGRIFIEYRTACVGCLLTRFCTLKEMTTLYALDLPSFLNALQESSLPASESKKGE